MKAARQKFPNDAWMLWCDHPDGGLIFAVAKGGVWNVFDDDGWSEPDDPRQGQDDIVLVRGFGHTWLKPMFEGDAETVGDILGWPVANEEEGDSGDCKKTGDTWELWFGSDFYAKLAPQPPAPEPEPEPTPVPQPKPEPEDTLLRILSLIEVLLSRLVMQRVGQGDWVWLPNLDAPLNLNFVGHVHRNGTIQYGFYDTVLVLPDEDVELVRQKLARRCMGGSEENADARLAATGRSERAC